MKGVMGVTSDYTDQTVCFEGGEGILLSVYTNTFNRRIARIRLTDTIVITKPAEKCWVKGRF